MVASVAAAVIASEQESTEDQVAAKKKKKANRSPAPKPRAVSRPIDEAEADEGDEDLDDDERYLRALVADSSPLQSALKAARERILLTQLVEEDDEFREAVRAAEDEKLAQNDYYKRLVERRVQEELQRRSSGTGLRRASTIKGGKKRGGLTSDDEEVYRLIKANPGITARKLGDSLDFKANTCLGRLKKAERIDIKHPEKKGGAQYYPL